MKKIWNLIIYIKSLSTKDWKVIDGKIISSEIEISRNLTNETYENTYRAKIIYQYEINGQKLESERIYFGDTVFISNKSKG